jgi:hypothetical protein
MPASHFDVNSMTGRPKFIVRHSTSNYIQEGIRLSVNNSFLQDKKIQTTRNVFLFLFSFVDLPQLESENITAEKSLKV